MYYQGRFTPYLYTLPPCGRKDKNLSLLYSDYPCDTYRDEHALRF